MKEIEFARTIQNLGGHAYIVGGWVRDLIMGRASSDKDYVVSGVPEAAFTQAFPDVLRVGRSFPVYLAEIDGRKCEVAFARTERKNGPGYRGFLVNASPEVTIEADLFRRDTTINSMAFDILAKALIDPYGGQRDIEQKTIRATSRHFSEDPVRALRAARQAAQFSFQIEPETVARMRESAQELREEPKERIFSELKKALGADKPSPFFRNLERATLLQIIFPHLHDLIGKAQLECFHPEGDAFEHTMLALDKSAKMTDRLEVRFAVLMHDIGKGTTKESVLPHHYGHEKTGLDLLKRINEKFPLPRRWYQCAEIAIREHMRAPRLTHAGKIVDLLIKISKHPIGFDGFRVLLLADCGWLPEYFKAHEKYMKAWKEIDLQIPKDLQGPAIALWVREKQIETYVKLGETR